MAFKLGPLNLNAVAQGVGGLVFGSGNKSPEDDDGGVEELLERISNGKLADDRRNAMAELEVAVAENRAAKLAFGAMGFPILMAVFREERDDLEMVRHAFLPYMVSEGYLFPNIIFSSSPLRVGIRSFSLSIVH
jgi:hypothetical protein